MADNYKKKLETFIAEIPMHPSQVVSGTANPVPYSEQFKKDVQDPVKSKSLESQWPTNDVFMKLTGTNHFTLIKNWAGGGIMTTCNGFVGKCGNAMGAKDFLGQFELEDFLRSKGKGHAWIPANSGKRPAYGDIFRPVKFHMGVSLGFNGNDWLTVESGQGGSRSGFDAIKRYKKSFDPALLLGWCDMRLYLDSRPPMPDWLKGMWIIYCGDKTYIYQFNEYYEAYFYPWKPIGDPRNSVPTDTGTVSFQGSDSFTVTWSKEGGTEKFAYDRWESFPGIMEKVTGKSNLGEPLKGIRQ